MKILRRTLRPLLVCALLAGPTPLAAQQPQAAPVRAHRPSVPGVHGLVTTGGQPLAAMAGVRVLMAGGNAADAAVAVMAALNVVQPEMSGAGGNAFMTYYEKSTGKVYSLGMTGAAPMALKPAEMTPEKLGGGYLAGIVPGAFGGWVALLDRFGTKSLAEVLTPAIGYAADGHPLDPGVARSIERNRESFEKYASSGRVFLPGGRLPQAGELFRQPDLAATFRKVAEAETAALGQGKARKEALRAAFDRFYTGDIAQEMTRFYQEKGGLFTAADFAAYEPIWAEPLHVNYRGYDVYTSPSTSRGGFEVAMQLNLMEGYDVRSMGHNSPELLHLSIEAIKVAKSDIYRYVADPKFTRIPVAGMLSEEYAAQRRRLIDRARAIAYPEPGDPARLTATAARADYSSTGTPERPRLPERSQEGSTTSFSVADAHGNVAVITPTLGSLFGTGVVVGNTGLFFNNGTRIGSTSPYPDNVNYVRGGQIPILNNSPIVVLRDGEFHLALGTPGGETIGQTQFQVMMNLLDFGMGIQEAIEAPRFTLVAEPNFYKPGSAIEVRIEDRVPADAVQALTRMGHRMEVGGAYSIGNMQGILRNLSLGTLTAGADPRSSGYAIGW